MRIAVLAVASAVLLLLGGSGSAMAQGLGPSTSPGRAAGETKGAPGPGPQKPVAAQPKKVKASPSLEPASRREPDSPVLSLLWLLTGASRRY